MTAETPHSPAYRDALQFLYSFIDYERNSRWKYDGAHFDLGRVREFFHALGDPHLRGRFVHVAGTNGKGSTAAMIAGALSRAGYRTGLYTSPHLITFRERIRIDGAFISHDEVIAGVERIRPVTVAFPGLTFFEVWTGLAFDHFAARGIDAGVIEVGMGGRLDTTNVITPEVSVITKVSMDHRLSLGPTIARIAAEKAGIIKPGVPAVSAPQYAEAGEVLERTACTLHAPFVLVGRDVIPSMYGGELSYRGMEWSLDHVRVPLPGAFQHENVAVALAALERLATGGYRLTPDIAREGIETVSWPGRLQTVAHAPAVIVDGACNIDAMHAVADHLRATAVPARTVALVGICQDKDIAEVLRVLGGVVSRFVFTRVDNPRAVAAEALAGYAPADVPFTVVSDPVRALAEASALAGPDGTVMVTGSLYLVGEIMRHLEIDPAPGMGAMTPVHTMLSDV